MNHLTVRDKGNVAKRYAYGGHHLPARSWIERTIQNNYPKIRIEAAEKESDSDASSKEKNQGTTEVQDVEMETPHPLMATQDTHMENASNGDEQPSKDKSQEGNSDNNTVVQSTKDDDSGKSKMYQEHTTFNQNTSKFIWICTSMSPTRKKTKAHLK
jgi:hypothetical protein